MIVEPEPNEALSVRKLVVETAKFNVVTAYSTSEAKELLRLFPNVDATVIVAETKDCEQAVKAAKATKASMPAGHSALRQQKLPLRRRGTPHL
jgi:peroxiredoxin